MTKPLSDQKRADVARQARRESARIREAIQESKATRKRAVPALRRAGYLRSK